MNVTDDFEVTGDLAIFHPKGELSLGHAIVRITAAITLARERGIKKFMIVTTDWTGFEPPNCNERYFFMKQWADAAGGRVQIAVVAKKEMIHPEKFGVTVARENGLLGDVFTSEDDALAWLQRTESETANAEVR